MNENKLLKNIVLNYLREAISGYIHDSKKEILYGDLKIRIEYSRDEKFGDYSSPVALENKSIFGENPKTTAEEIIKRIPGDSFESVSFSPPGFINFRIGKSFLISYLQETVMSPVASNIFAKSDKTEKIIFEFVSANPTGPLNIVSARAAAVGDSICNLLSKAGHEVQREFYVNDFGNQVFLLGVSCLARLREILGEPVKIEEEGENPGLEEILRENIIPMEGYRGDYVSTIAHHVYSSPERKNEIDSHIAKKEYKILAEKFSDWAVEANLGSQKKDLISFGVKFDNFYSEKTLHENGKVPAALKSLQKSGDTKTADGKEIFISTKFGDDKDRVIVRDDGRPTYLLADIAYHLSKIERGFTKLINIWGPDHHGYIARLKGALISLGYPKESFQILIAQQVNLLSGGEKVKMSKRLGNFQTMDELLEFLGKSARDVGRYFFVMRSIDVPLDFDLDLAKDESEKNPVFYIQYAHARICSIFRETGNSFSSENMNTLGETDERSRLLFWLARFPEEVFDSAQTMEPHRLANYLQNLSKSFTRFYSSPDNRLKTSDEKTRLALAYICKATAICLKEGLSILGISAPEKMEKE